MFSDKGVYYCCVEGFVVVFLGVYLGGCLGGAVLVSRLSEGIDERSGGPC